MCVVYIGEAIWSGTTSKLLWSNIYSFLVYFGLIVYHLYKSPSYALDAMYNNHYLRSLAEVWPTYNTVLLNGCLAIDHYCRREFVQRSPGSVKVCGNGGLLGAGLDLWRSCISKVGTLICAEVCSTLRTPSEGEKSCADTVLVCPSVLACVCL